MLLLSNQEHRLRLHEVHPDTFEQHERMIVFYLAVDLVYMTDINLIQLEKYLQFTLTAMCRQFHFYQNFVNVMYFISRIYKPTSELD